MLFLAESPVGPPLWLTTALAFAAVLLAAILATMFHHWQWLRERRLAEYADLLTAFRAVTSASATAIGGSAVYDTGDPDQYRVLQNSWWRRATRGNSSSQRKIVSNSY